MTPAQIKSLKEIGWLASSQILKADKLVDDFLEEFARLEHIISEKPDIKPPIPGEAIEQFQRLWEACVGLSEKADFKVLFGYAARLEKEIEALKAKLTQK